MNGKMMPRAKTMTLNYFLTSTKKTLCLDQRLIHFAQRALWPDSALLLEYPKKNGGSGAVSILKMERSLGNSTVTVAKKTGEKPGRTLQLTNYIKAGVQMYTDEMRKAFRSVEAPPNFYVDIADEDHFLSVIAKEEVFMRLDDFGKRRAVEYLARVKHALEDAGAIVLLVREGGAE